MKNEIEHVEVTAVESNALFAMERAEIDIQIATAKKYPRSIEVFHQQASDMIRANKQIAAECIYRRPVGKEEGKMKYVEGPSVRLAEIVAACYGNLRIATIITEVSPRQVKAQGIAFDLEKNIAVKKDCLESTVTKQGVPFTERMRVIVAKACQSKAMRDAIFGVVPRALCTPLLDLAANVALGGKTLDESRKAVGEWIKGLNIPEQRVWDAIDVKGLRDISTTHLHLLAGLRTAIQDGDCTIDEAFPPPENGKTDSVAERIKDHFAGSREKVADKRKKEKKPKKTKHKKTLHPTAQASAEQEPTADRDSEKPDAPTPAQEQPAQPGGLSNRKCVRCHTIVTDPSLVKCPKCLGGLEPV